MADLNALGKPNTKQFLETPESKYRKVFLSECGPRAGLAKSPHSENPVYQALGTSFACCDGNYIKYILSEFTELAG